MLMFAYVDAFCNDSVMPWPWKREVQKRSAFSVGDPMLAQMLGYQAGNVSGQTVTESTALALSAVWRSVSLVSGAIAGLPLRTLLTTADGQQERAASFLDNPAGPDRATPFEWCELAMVHLLLNGNVFAQHVYNGGGALAGLNLIHPLACQVELNEDVPGGKLITVTLNDGTKREFDSTSMTHIPAMSLDGLRGISPITVARNSLGTGLAADRAAARMFANGALISGMVTPIDEDLTPDEAKVIKASIQSKIMGEENAGDVAVINRKLTFTPWQMNADDAQFLQSRVFQIEEIGRWWGVPPHLLGQTEKATSWGQGIAEQNRGLARYTLTPWTSRVEQRLSRLIPSNRIVEFDYSAFIKPSPEDEINLLIAQVNSGLLTLNEARRIRNLPAVEGGDLPRTPPGAIPPTDPNAPAPTAPADAPPEAPVV